jgi:hypothetical protein
MEGRNPELAASIIGANDERRAMAGYDLCPSVLVPGHEPGKILPLICGFL